MSEDAKATELLVRCDCGFEARGTEERLVPVGTVAPPGRSNGS